MAPQITEEEIMRPISIFRGNSGNDRHQITIGYVDLVKDAHTIRSNSEISESEAIHSDY